MRATAFQIQTELAFVTEDCCACGVAFAMTREHRAQRLKDKALFYCPNGHSQSYTESEADRLRRQLEEKAIELAAKERALAWEKERAASLDRQLAKEKQSTAKLKRRISRGVCPCCQRTVSQLARHMETKHPEFVKAPA